MNANQVIESYVNDVAVQVARRQRNDVAYELRELINEGLQARAAAADRQVDAALALEYLHEFGHPDVVAARYRQPVTIIDPADGASFLRVSIIGMLVIGAAGQLELFLQPAQPGVALLSLIGHWWSSTISTLVSSLWWPGVLVVSYGLSAWFRRNSQEQASEWRPSASDHIYGGRAMLCLGLFGVLFGAFVLLNPTWVLDVVWNGRAAPEAYQALTYTDAFLGRQAPWLFALILLNVPIMLAALKAGRWTDRLLQFESAMVLATCAMMLWVVFDGPVMMTKASDSMAKFLMLIIVVMTLGYVAIKAWRAVKPRPA